MGQAISLPRITGDAGTDDVFPSRLSSAITRHYMVKVEVASLKDPIAILAGILVPLEDIVSSELDLLFWQSLKEE